MPQLIPLYDLNQLNDFVDLPLPTIVKAKAGHDYIDIDSNLREFIAEYPQIRLATFDIYEQRDIAMELSITEYVFEFLDWPINRISAPQLSSCMNQVKLNIKLQVQEFIEKAEEALH
ncbi:hypothetical protein E3Q24_01753 [Wallemia mellicola]|uniref:Uncharacterized protein n=1 Tax=Wallemia mellicola TaxID=1708541 RepID=A0AB74K9U0_9BASI|nr:hypothetical protein E3Q24_01753 [Wallemia mellicola]TIC51590.1 hypothetical protein E3Q04_03758 [Wallemia mellicola]TIC59878.1 hypothetical protein E3Q03_03661 [Wallemia mellicola]